MVKLVDIVPGVSIPQITKELLKRLPWLTKNPHYPNGPSEDVVAHLLSPPNKGRNASKQYRAVVQTKLARGRNDFEDFLPFVISLLCFCLVLSLNCLDPGTRGQCTTQIYQRALCTS
jgi:hypothetical protein